MSDLDLSSGVDFLRGADLRYLRKTCGNPRVYQNEALGDGLNWKPAIRFVRDGLVNVFHEPSESRAYPRIFSLRHADVLQYGEPIEIYCVCPEEVFLRPVEQPSVRKLQDHGFGLITVNTAGDCYRRFPAVPLVQVVSAEDLANRTRNLPPSIRQRVMQCYDDYKARPANGVATLSELVESVARQAANDAVAKTWISKGDAKGATADILDAMYICPSFKNARAAIGGVRSYINQFRNVSHHLPTNRKAAYTRYVLCRDGFLDGISRMVAFRDAMRQLKLSGGLLRMKQ